MYLVKTVSIGYIESICYKKLQTYTINAQNASLLRRIGNVNRSGMLWNTHFQTSSSSIPEMNFENLIVVFKHVEFLCMKFRKQFHLQILHQWWIDRKRNLFLEFA